MPNRREQMENFAAMLEKDFQRQSLTEALHSFAEDASGLDLFTFIEKFKSAFNLEERK